ncbi:MAG: hypothetical protein U9R54_02720 [Bacteroidota bacterium]|nr:hypothetical protein [Bacteroidota bacterium]
MNSKEEYIKQANIKINNMLTLIKKHKYNAILTLEETEKEVNNQLEELKTKQTQAEEALTKLKNSSEEAWDDAKEEFENTIKTNFFDSLKTRMDDMGSKIKDWASRTDETRNAFLDKAKKEISDLNIGIQDLEKKASETQEFARKKLKEQIEYLKNKKSEMQAKFEEASNSDDNAWTNIKKGYEETKGFFKRKFHSTKDNIN